MAEPQIRFIDGAAYERMMGVWSRLAGEGLYPLASAARRLTMDRLGCGSGAFTQLLADRCAPADVQVWPVRAAPKDDPLV